MILQMTEEEFHFLGAKTASIMKTLDLPVELKMWNTWAPEPRNSSLRDPVGSLPASHTLSRGFILL